MTITLYWWYVPLAFVLIPLIYGTFRKPASNWWDFELDTIAIALFCWAFAIAFTIARLI